MSKHKKKPKYPEFIEICKFSTDPDIRQTITLFASGIFPKDVSYNKSILQVGESKIPITKNYLNDYLSILSALNKLKTSSIENLDTVTTERINEHNDFTKMNSNMKDILIYSYCNSVAEQKQFNHTIMKRLNYFIKVYITTGMIKESDVVMENGNVTFIPMTDAILSFLL